MENTMLIVDDSVLNREILTLLFEDNFEILEADTGKKALEMLEHCNGNIDIVLLDLMMPCVNGIEVLKMRKNLDYFKSVPVVVITASNATDDQIEAFRLGANDFIVKPFISEIVRSRVNNVLASTRRIEYMQLETERLRLKSEQDEMTGLYNKATTINLVSKILEKEHTRCHAMLMIDIDNFKAVNDLNGHLVGDHTIKIVADAISGLFRKDDVVGRVGGDEFLVFMANVPSRETVRGKVSELIKKMKYKPNLTIPANVTMSIGFSITEGQEITYDQLFRQADEALYLAKKAGKARAQEYGVTHADNSSDMRSRVLIIGGNRGVSSIIDAQLASVYHITEVKSIAELKAIPDEEMANTVLAYADVSDFVGCCTDFWHELSDMPAMHGFPVIAVCEEGNLAQYKDALDARVDDILSSPIEISAFRRCTARHLELKSEE